MTYLARYQNGEYERVWEELTALGEQVRQEPLLSDALAVAYETMSRVRENVQRIIPRLQSIGYDFDYPSYVVAYEPPEGIKDQILELERLAGPLPLSLRAWYEVGGSVNLMGFDALWPSIYTDPLVIEPIEVAFSEHQDWKEHVADVGLEEVGPFCIPIAPDFYHKDNTSGGAPYTIEMPNSCADAPLVDEWHDTTFVKYLRLCFRCGGFLGLDIAHPMNPNGKSDGFPLPIEHFRLLTSALLPI